MSLMAGVSKAWNAATVSGLGRSMSVRMRNPGPGCISADFGFPTILRLLAARLRCLPPIGRASCVREPACGPSSRAPEVTITWAARESAGPTSQLPMRVIHLARYAGPYPGSFISMLRAAATECERRGWRSEAVFDPVAADRPWYAELARELPVRVSPEGADRAALTAFVRSLLAEDDGPTVVHTHFSGFDLPAAAAARRRPRTAVVWHLHTRLDPGVRVALRNIVKFAVLGRGVSRI